MHIVLVRYLRAYKLTGYDSRGLCIHRKLERFNDFFIAVQDYKSRKYKLEEKTPGYSDRYFTMKYWTACYQKREIEESARKVNKMRKDRIAVVEIGFFPKSILALKSRGIQDSTRISGKIRGPSIWKTADCKQFVRPTDARTISDNDQPEMTCEQRWCRDSRDPRRLFVPFAPFFNSVFRITI